MMLRLMLCLRTRYSRQYARYLASSWRKEPARCFVIIGDDDDYISRQNGPNDGHFGLHDELYKMTKSQSIPF